ncbi:MAG: ESPR domain-containing protein, partial [Haemophilus parainfluenzae]|nr:ESPR domain-containing protein [Haemophilus parainfluenzae]
MCLVCIILALQRLVNLFVWENLFMNKVFKIIWNKTTQSFVVTSELAKGAVKASSNSEQRVINETRLSSLFKL